MCCAAVVADHVDQGRSQVGGQEIEVIRGEVAAANQQVDFGHSAFHRGVVKLRLDVIGNGQELDCAWLVQFGGRWSVVGSRLLSGNLSIR